MTAGGNTACFAPYQVGAVSLLRDGTEERTAHGDVRMDTTWKSFHGKTRHASSLTLSGHPLLRMSSVAKN